ncbi:MAG: TIM barrel protein [Pseudomonadota bacterium]
MFRSKDVVSTLFGTGRGSEAVFVENIQWAADQCPDILLNLEPLNARDVPDYLHSNSGETVRLIEKIDRPNVRLQYDFYHMQIMEGDLAANVMARMEHISHIQFSSVPGRHEPQFGEVNIPYLIELLDEVGYEGWIGCEYKAKTDTKSGLSWGLPYGLGKEM